MLVLFMDASFVDSFFDRKVVNVALSCNLDTVRKPSNIDFKRTLKKFSLLFMQAAQYEQNDESFWETFYEAAGQSLQES